MIGITELRLSNFFTNVLYPKSRENGGLKHLLAILLIHKPIV